PTPPLYAPLPGSARIHVGEEPPAGFPDAFNAVLVLECPTLDRTGLEERLAGIPTLPLVNVDHHLGNQHYAQTNWVDTAAPALGQAAAPELADGGRVATALLSREMFARCGASPGESEGLVDYPRSIAGVHAVGLLREVTAGRWKVSLRSRADIDVEQVA